MYLGIDEGLGQSPLVVGHVLLIADVDHDHVQEGRVVEEKVDLDQETEEEVDQEIETEGQEEIEEEDQEVEIENPTEETMINP